MVSLAKYLSNKLISISEKRDPDFEIERDNEGTYLRRWYVIPRNKFFNVYLHRFLLSDHDKALHDHPWVSCSVLLEGSYLEHTPEQIHYRPQGTICFRKPSSAHRVELIKGKPVWTLFLTGPRVRKWGFLCPKGWKPWDEYCDPKNPGKVLKGCDG